MAFPIHLSSSGVPISWKEKKNGTQTPQWLDALSKRMRTCHQKWDESKQILLHLEDTLSSQAGIWRRFSEKHGAGKMVVKKKGSGPRSQEKREMINYQA